jgi:hypothetical protein
MQTGKGAAAMRYHYPEQRLQTALERRLCSAPPVLRAIATATSVCFEWPDFEITAGQKAAANTLIQHLADARTAFRGQLDEDDALDIHEGLPNATYVCRPDERLAALGQAIVRLDRASRMLRQRGLKLSVRVATSGRADLTVRPAGVSLQE